MTHALQDAGYNLLALPSAKVAPLDVFAVDGTGRARRLGPLERLVRTTRPPPPIDAPTATPDVTAFGDQTLQTGFGAKLLELLPGLNSLLGGRGNLSAERAHHAHYRDLEERSVELLDLVGFLADAEAELQSPLVAEALRQGQLYVVTDVIDSAGVSVGHRRHTSVGASADVPLEQLVQVHAETSGGTASDTGMTFEGGQRLVIAVKVVALRLDGGRLGIEWGNPGDVTFDSPRGPEVVFTDALLTVGEAK